MEATTNAPAILSSHKVAELTVTRFRTRFGNVVWMVSDERLSGHKGLYQGDIDGAIKVLRELLRS